MEIPVEIGRMYAVTTDSTCTVSLPGSMKTLVTATAGQQAYFMAQSNSVIISDDNAQVTRANFKGAPLVLGQPSGGNSTALPAGYFSVSFLEFRGASIFETGYVPSPNTGFSFDVYIDGTVTAYTSLAGNNMKGGNSNYVYVYGVLSHKSLFYINKAYYPLRDGGWANTSSDVAESNAYLVDNTRVTGSLNWCNDNHFRANTADYSLFREMPQRMTDYSAPLSIGHGAVERTLTHAFSGRLYSFSISEGAAVVRRFQPALNSAGKPCLYDLEGKSNELLNVTSTQPIVGMTIAQARKLDQLPAGTKLAISLPASWQEDAGVVAARENAIANGCELPIQTYEAAGNASTYALRRVWVRRAQDDNGSYVDADGTRWLVDWCEDVWGADPETLGYERFRSVDVAIEYWGLTPYEYPEEELSTID